MKKLSINIMLITAALVLCTHIAEAGQNSNATVNIDLDPATTVIDTFRNVPAGEVFDVDLVINDASNLIGFNLVVTFPQNILEVQSATEGPFLKSAGASMTLFMPALEPGSAEVSSAIFGSGIPDSQAPDGDGVLAHLTFKVLSDQQADIVFSTSASGTFLTDNINISDKPIALGNANGATVNGDDKPTVGFSTASSSGLESVTAVDLDVVLSKQSADIVKVDYSVTGGTALGGGVDYTIASGPLTFPAGSTAPQTIKITVVDDSLYESDETIIVKLSNPLNATLGTKTTHTYTILADVTMPTVGFDVSSSEGSESITQVNLTVNISGASSQEVKVNYAVTGGTAKGGGEDYTIAGSTLTFPAGSTASQTIKITINNDTLDENNETIIVELTSATNANIGTANHTYKILDNDDPPTVSFTQADSEGKEGTVSQKTLVVDLSKVSGRNVTVGYSVSGTAKRDDDYILNDGTLTFLEGRTKPTKDIILTIVDDDFGEPAETVIVTLSADSPTVEPGTKMQYTYTILNDDLPSVAFAADSSIGYENDGPAILPVVLSPFLGDEVTVKYNIDLNASTAQADDYTLIPGTLVFPAGAPAGQVTKNIEIQITKDSDQESNETVVVTLSNPSGATIGTKGSHTYTIVNDDDETDPSTYGHIPKPGSVQAARDTIIQLHITDDMIASTSGVDLDTINIKVEDVVIYDGDAAEPNGTYRSTAGICRLVGTEADYMFVFQSKTLFDYEQKVDVVVYAEDKAGRSMTEPYHFYAVMRTFGPNIKVNSDTGTLVQNHPATAMDYAGNIWIVWDETTAAGDTDIYIGKIKPDGGIFETSVPVISDPNNQRNPAIAIDSSNVLYVVWEEEEFAVADPNRDILLLTSTDGKTWTGGPYKVNADLAPGTPDPVTQNPAIAIAINITTGGITTDVIYVTWEEERDGNKEIWVNKGDIGSSVVWKGTTRVTNHPQDQTEPAIALDLAGTAYIVWTDERGTSTDIYGADSLTGNWENKVVVATSAREWSPAIATESSGTVLHLLWVDNTDPNGTIFYGATTGGLQELLVADIQDVVDSPKYPQSAPSIAVDGARETARVFACWQDERNVADPDIYYAETGSNFGTDILVNDDVGTSAQTAPAIGIDKDGDPYMGWVDNRLGNSDIYGAGSTTIGPALKEIEINAANGGTVEVDGVTIEIPRGALPVDIKVTIAELINPPSLPPGGYGVPYEFGPSGLVFNEPVTITIPHSVADCPGHPINLVFWYNAQTGEWSRDGITNDVHLTQADVPSMPSGFHVVQFDTTHFTTYGAGGGAPGAGGGGGGGGCDISATGRGNVIEYMLPYVFLAVVWVIIKRKDARNRRTI